MDGKEPYNPLAQYGPSFDVYTPIKQPIIKTPLPVFTPSIVPIDKVPTKEQRAMRIIHEHWSRPSLDPTFSPKKIGDLIFEMIQSTSSETDPSLIITAADLDKAATTLWWGKFLSPLDFHSEVDMLITYKGIHTLAVMMALSLVHALDAPSSITVDDEIVRMVDAWNSPGVRGSKTNPLFVFNPGVKKDVWIGWIRKSYKHLSMHKDSLGEIFADYEEGGFLPHAFNENGVWTYLGIRTPVSKVEKKFDNIFSGGNGGGGSGSGSVEDLVDRACVGDGKINNEVDIRVKGLLKECSLLNDELGSVNKRVDDSGW